MHGKNNAILCFSTITTIILAGEAQAACPDPPCATPPTCEPPHNFVFADVTDAPGTLPDGTCCSGIKPEDGGKMTLGDNMVAGAAAADFDRDGWVDVFVSWGKTALYHNQGDGTFLRRQDVGIPVTLAAVTPGGLWFDYDNDGDLDLLVPLSRRRPVGAEPIL